MFELLQGRRTSRRKAGINSSGLGRFLSGLAIFSLCASFAAGHLPGFAGAETRAEKRGAQEPRGKENSQDPLSRQRLTPPLRGGATLRYSPNGRYLLVQDPAGVYLVSRYPLKRMLHIEAPDNYPARFSADSKVITLVSWDLQVGTWRLSDAQKIEQKVLPIKDGCLGAEISPDALSLACLRPNITLGLYRLPAGEQLVTNAFERPPIEHFLLAVQLDSRTPLAHPFGTFMSNDSKELANRGLQESRIVFT